MKRETRAGHIIGIIDAYGAIHAEFTGPKVKHHAEIFPGQTFCRWRWSHSEGVYLTPGAEPLTDEQADSIARLLEKKWGIEA